MSTDSADWVPVPTAQAAAGREDWRAGLIRVKEKPAPVLANAITALRMAPEWAGRLAFDEFAIAAVIQGETPWGGGPCAVTDHEDRLVADWLQHHGVLVSPEIAGQAIQVVARDRVFHPVRDYLNGLEWDGTKRIDGWPHLYLGVTPSDYSAAVGVKVLVSAVARIFGPGAKVDCVPILEGEQGRGKSTAVRILAGRWFTDELGEPGSKDASLQLRSVWFVEIAELDALTRAEVSRIKAFISRPVDRFRPPYGRHLVESPRQCVFVGTVNHNVYLRDETGGRRFWPLACTRILLKDLARDRDQLWAEALVRYRAGETWWLEGAGLIKEAEQEQAARYDASAWDSLILAWTEERLRAGFDSVSTAEVLDLCIKKPAGQWTRADEMRVGACLRQAKWVRFRDRKDGWRYRPPPCVPTSA